jgi:hypothetical protein
MAVRITRRTRNLDWTEKSKCKAAAIIRGFFIFG